MASRWTQDEKADALTERQNNQPYSVVAELLNKKYHSGNAMRTAIGNTIPDICPKI
jgi:hypothetical protein